MIETPSHVKVEEPTPNISEVDAIRALDKIADLRAEYAKAAEGIDERMAALQAERDALVSSDGETYRDRLSRLENAAVVYVLVLQKTVKGRGLMAVYSGGRVTWDGKRLDGYAMAHPDILAARQVGAPSVSLRTIK